MSWTIKTSLPVEFEIRRVDNVLTLDAIDSNRKIVVIDQTVYDLYHKQLSNDIVVLPVNCTEKNKTWETAHKILSFFEDQKLLRRSEPVIAIGGGVLLDVVGYCASIYRRGIPYIRIPTTLLAIVDASVGAKTSINHFERRNRIGSFYPPVSTLIDQSFIKTQDTREIANGVAEIIKLAIATDKTLFELLEVNPSELIKQKFQHSYLAEQVIDRSIAGMINELNDNLWENDLQRKVDFGHSFSPIIEMRNIPKLLHGEAVILDCLLSSCISFNRGMLLQEDLTRIFNLVKAYNLPTLHNDFLDSELLHTSLTDVMLHRNYNQYLPLPTSIGCCAIVNDVDLKEIKLAVERLKDYA